MKKIIIICILIFIPFVVNSKELEQEWDLNYGLIAVIIMITSLMCYYFIYSVCQKENTYL